MGNPPLSVRDDVETVIRSWNAHEVDRGAGPIIDYDCVPTDAAIAPASSRLDVYRRLAELRRDITAGPVAERIDADLAYLRALMGERAPLVDYVRSTQGCAAAGWPEDYVTERREIAGAALQAIGVDWGSDTPVDLEHAEGLLDVKDAPDAIRQAADRYEPTVRKATGTTAPYDLSIETTDIDAYWAYWLDGAGRRVRLRLNLRNARFTEVGARQFALHEVLGHGLQSASLADRCAREDVPWVRLLSVHAPHQVMLEGLAQAMPLFVAPNDQALTARVQFDHYNQLIKAELHLAINAGDPIEECAQHAHDRAPYLTDAQISDSLTDRGANPLLPMGLPRRNRLLRRPRRRRPHGDPGGSPCRLPRPTHPDRTPPALAQRTAYRRTRTPCSSTAASNSLTS
jgi:hypothetical protein